MERASRLVYYREASNTSPTEAGSLDAAIEAERLIGGHADLPVFSRVGVNDDPAVQRASHQQARVSLTGFDQRLVHDAVNELQTASRFDCRALQNSGSDHTSHGAFSEGIWAGTKDAYAVALLPASPEWRQRSEGDPNHSCPLWKTYLGHEVCQISPCDLFGGAERVSPKRSGGFQPPG
jgi:hypothetical protein